jgi:non-ribosomal peptide synthetase component F
MGYRIYILDEYGQPVMPGQPGEIVIGGEPFV